jgi:phage tail-like protein
VSDHDLEYLGSQFGLEIDGVELARFTGISGLGYESEVVTFQDTLADGKIITRKRPGRISFPDIVLKRGLSADNALVDWYQTVVDGSVERKSGSIVIYDGDRPLELRECVDLQVERLRSRCRHRRHHDRGDHHRSRVLGACLILSR